MSKIDILDGAGTRVGEVDIDDKLLVLDRGGQAVHDVVVAYMAAQRKGTASSLSKGEVRGSNRKPWRQKGTGRARAGYRQSPVWRGGAAAFGPKPRDYGKKVPKKVAWLAFRRALSEHLVGGSIRVVDQLSIAEPRTKLFTDWLHALQVEPPAVVVLDQPDRNVLLSSRNVPGVEVVTAGNINTYQLMRYPAVVATKSAMEALTARLSRGLKKGE